MYTSTSTVTLFKLLFWLISVVAVVLVSQVQCRTLAGNAQAAMTTLTRDLRRFCGVEDNVSNRRRRDAPDNRWPAGSNLTYSDFVAGVDKHIMYIDTCDKIAEQASMVNVCCRVGAGPTRGILKDADIGEIARLAFREWAPHCGLHFTQIHSGEANITISFISRADLNCPNYIQHDGPEGFIGHVTNLPSKTTQSVQVHIDDEEEWSLFYAPGHVEFYRTLLHELGHALGLLHSDNYRSIMNTLYKPDIAGILDDGAESNKTNLTTSLLM